MFFCCTDDYRTNGAVESVRAAVQKDVVGPELGTSSQYWPEPADPQPTKVDESLHVVVSPPKALIEPPAAPEPKIDSVIVLNVMSTFEMVLDPKLGIDFDEASGTLICVIKVYELDGQTCRQTSSLRHADRITAVDGDRDIKGIVAKLKDGKDCWVSVMRPEEFKLILRKSESCGKIGVNVSHSGQQSLIIKSLKEGMFAQYNTTHPDHIVKAGDRIVEVNGIRHDSERILAELSRSSVLEVVISRAA